MTVSIDNEQNFSLNKKKTFLAESDHIVIDTPTLEKLLHALDARSISGWYHPAMRMQNELIASKEREFALKERVRKTEQIAVIPTSIEETSKIEIITSNTKIDDRNISSSPKIDPISVVQPIPSPKMQHSSCDINNFDKLVQLIIDQDKQLENSRNDLEKLTELHRESILTCEELKIMEQQYHNLTHSLSASEDQSELLLAKNAEEIVVTKNSLNEQTKKCEFFENDYKQLKFSYQTTKDHFSHLVYELRKELLIKNESVQQSHPRQAKDPFINNADIQRELAFLKFKTSKFTGNMMKTFTQLELDNNLRLDFERLQKLAIVQNNLPIDFIAKTELDQLKSDLRELQQRDMELTRKSKHLEELLQLTQAQVICKERFKFYFIHDGFFF